jgi:hypothetical protein
MPNRLSMDLHAERRLSHAMINARTKKMRWIREWRCDFGSGGSGETVACDAALEREIKSLLLGKRKELALAAGSESLVSTKEGRSLVGVDGGVLAEASTSNWREM